MELRNFFHFNIELCLSSSTVIGSPSYYPYRDAHFFYTIIDTTLENFFSIHSYIIHGNRSPSPWLLAFLNIKIRNPHSPLPAPRSLNSHPQ
jgi:hypothetical protein